MTAVLRLVSNTNKETVDALAYMLHEAQAGKLTSVSATFRRCDGDEEALCTGAYKAHPELALMALLRVSLVLIRADGLGP